MSDPSVTRAGRAASPLKRERRTVEVMIRMYCREHHDPPSLGTLSHSEGDTQSLSGLCGECAELLRYSEQRIDACKFGAEKPTCARCSVHCFRKAERDRIKVVMRYAGPRMTLRHPYLAVRHLLRRGAV